jgi:adenine-specific DNA methylase
LHVWWARRPLAVSRAAVLASLLPADFDRATFERLLGFGRPATELVQIRARMDTGVQVEGGFGCGRAFSNPLRESDLEVASREMLQLWGAPPTIIDPMAGGGSIPLEAARLGVNALAGEYNPVACSVLEATVDYPFRFGPALAERARHWGKVWEERAAKRLAPVYPREKLALVHAYIFARTVPCPHTPGQPPTPLVPDWSLLRPKGGTQVVAEPVKVDATTGSWTMRVREVGKGAGQLRQPPAPTYSGGKGISLYTHEVIPSDYIKAMAQQGRMGSALYAVVTKATKQLSFRPAEPRDLEALRAAEEELARLRPGWEREGIIPTELYPEVSSDERPRLYGMPRWADMFAPRQLLALGVLVEELRRLRSEIVAAEGQELGEAVVHLLAFCLDKFLNYNAMLASWNAPRQVIRSVFDRHDYAFKATYAEMAACVAGSGLAWAIENVLEAYEKLAELPRAANAQPVAITQGSAANLPHLEDASITAVVVDPPYADNVQYSELADFFYVWLKRTQGHRRPEWFSTYLCEHAEEAVVNVVRFRDGASQKAKGAREAAQAFYQDLMTRVFCEAHRVLRDDGALTVMFTHKQQSAWAALFESLIAAGFTITATWPVQTESQHSLHQARKNAAQSTVVLVARKREADAGRGYYDPAMRTAIRTAAQSAAARLKGEGLNAVDQLVGAFGPAMEVFTRYVEVRTDTGKRVKVEEAIQVAADAVAEWRVEQLAQRGLEGVDPESRFVLLCWDVLGAAEFRFNEAMLLGRSVGMDVNRLLAAGLVEKKSDKVYLLSASDRRRERPITEATEHFTLLNGATKRGQPPSGSIGGQPPIGSIGGQPPIGSIGGQPRVRRQIHPEDALFASAIDMCHALALRWAEAGAGQAGIGAARGMALEQGWDAESPCARLMEALVQAAPQGVRFPGKGNKKTAADDFPEFRAWHAMLKPLFGIQPPVWKEATEPQPRLAGFDEQEDETEDKETEE